MRFLQVVFLEYVLGYVLQGFMYCLGIYAFSLKKVETKKYLFASGIFIVISYIMRLLPVSFGVHTILDLICLFILGVLFLKMPALSTIRSILAITVLLLITELISVFLMTNLLGQALFDTMMTDSLGKAIIALPSSLIFALLITLSYVILMKLRRNRA